MAATNSPFQLRTTRSGREFSAFAGCETILTGHDFTGAIRTAAERDEAGLGSPVIATVHLASPAASAASFDVPRASSPFEPDRATSPCNEPLSSPITLPPVSPSWSGPSSPALSTISLDLVPDVDVYGGESEPESLPASSAPSSPSSSRQSLSPELVPDTKKRKRRAGDNAAHSERRLRKRKSLRNLPTDLVAPCNPHQAAPLAISTEMASETHFPVTTTGYTGEHVETIKPGEVWLFDDLLAQGFKVFHWDGITPYAILDSQNRIVGVLVGRPTGRTGDTSEWEAVTAEFERAIDVAQMEISFTSEDTCHRRGAHTAKAFGLSHGNGQTQPSIRRVGASKGQDAINQAALRKFCENKAVRRFAGFASSDPKLYERYCDYMGRLAAADPAIKAGWNFPNSVFPCTTINFGPTAICYDHLDFSNAAAGWCSISCAGTFDHEKGGHLVLYDIDKIIEFPAGSTILIPSSVMRHGNTPVQEGEKRVGMTQYAAGGLFRWVDNGFKKARVGKRSREEEEEAELRFSKLLQLYSRIDELAADREKVFRKVSCM
ncbi:hypothetical protein HWV62_40152 [Athelia sp. TMB]|nr:hypothetical protein HWV62_40152 [Athelia sp. TMB]